ncbi:hypothetical protein EDC01DRAFT_683198, partial [Geopyxis carbonaria]
MVDSQHALAKTSMNDDQGLESSSSSSEESIQDDDNTSSEVDLSDHDEEDPVVPAFKQVLREINLEHQTALETQAADHQAKMEGVEEIVRMLEGVDESRLRDLTKIVAMMDRKDEELEECRRKCTLMTETINRKDEELEACLRELLGLRKVNIILALTILGVLGAFLGIAVAWHWEPSVREFVLNRI